MAIYGFNKLSLEQDNNFTLIDFTCHEQYGHGDFLSDMLLEQHKLAQGVVFLPFYLIVRWSSILPKLLRMHNVTASARQKSPASSDLSFVIQGPIHQFWTSQALKYYSTVFSEHRLILSTWEDTDKDLISDIEPYCDSIVLSKKPESGTLNCNLQLQTTKAGINRADQYDSKYVIKCRSDMVIMNIGIVDILKSAITIYPSAEAERYNLTGRLICIDRDTEKYAGIGVSDWIMFGYTKDMLKYWSAPNDTKKYDYFQQQQHSRVSDLSLNGYTPGNYYALNFCRLIGYPVTSSITDSWRFLRDLMIVLDYDLFDCYWFKRPNLKWDWGPMMENVTHDFWLSLLLHDDITKIKVPDWANNMKLIDRHNHRVFDPRF